MAACSATKTMDNASADKEAGEKTLDDAIDTLVKEDDGKLDRSKIPPAGPAPNIQIGDYETFTLDNGLKVFVVENNKLPRVTFSLIIDRDQILEGEHAGYVSAAGQLLSRGTTAKTKSQIDEEIDFMGATLNTSSTGVYGASLSKHKEKLMELMAEVILTPSFPAEELEKIKKQTISGIQSQKEDANAIASNVQNVLNYGKNHPYGELTTEKTVEAITIEDCKNYYDTYFRPNIGYLAIVGDITPAEAETLVKKHLSKWEQKEVPTHTYALPAKPGETIVALVDRPQAVQSVVNITYPVALKPGNTDVIKSRLMDNILGGGFSGRLFANLRETYGYTYGAYSSLDNDDLVGNFTASASVRNEVTDSAIVQFIYELKRIRENNVEDIELSRMKSYINGSFARSLESPQTIANFATNIERYNMPSNYYANYLKNVEEVSVADINAMAKKYVHPENAYILVVGKAAELADKLKAFGTVKYFDIYGEEYTPADAGDLPADITAEKIIGNYINAIGGKDKLNAVKNLVAKSNVSVAGQQLTMSEIKASSLKSKTELSMGGMTAQKWVTDGQSAQMMQMGQNIPLPDKMKDEAIVDYSLFPELFFDKLGVKMNLTGIEKVDGKDSYVIELTYKTEGKSTLYFDKETGYKVKFTKVIETPQGNLNNIWEYKNYKEVEGIKFPFSLAQTIGPQRINVEVESIAVNTELPADTFSTN